MPLRTSKVTHPLTACFIDQTSTSLSHFIILFHATSFYVDSTAYDWNQETLPCAAPPGGLLFGHLAESTPLTGCEICEAGTELGHVQEAWQTSTKLSMWCHPGGRRLWGAVAAEKCDVRDESGIEELPTLGHQVVGVTSEGSSV